METYLEIFLEGECPYIDKAPQSNVHLIKYDNTSTSFYSYCPSH